MNSVAINTLEIFHVAKLKKITAWFTERAAIGTSLGSGSTSSAVVITSIEAEGKAANLEYDARNRLVSTTDPNNIEVRGNRAECADAALLHSLLPVVRAKWRCGEVAFVG